MQTVAPDFPLGVLDRHGSSREHAACGLRRLAQAVRRPYCWAVAVHPIGNLHHAMPLPRPVRTYGLTHFAIAVRDPRRSLEFYRAVLGVVAVYEDELGRIADDVRKVLTATYGNRVLYYRSRSEAQRDTKDALGAEIGPILTEDARRIKARQREIDTPEEYASVSAACGGMIVK